MDQGPLLGGGGGEEGLVKKRKRKEKGKEGGDTVPGSKPTDRYLLPLRSQAGGKEEG